MIEKLVPVMIKENSSYNEIHTTLCAYINNAISPPQTSPNIDSSQHQINPPTANSYHSSPDSSQKRPPPIRPKDSKILILIA